MGHIPDDRFAEGLVPDFDIQSNLVLGAQRDPAFSKPGLPALRRDPPVCA
jgi:ABC-type uncharacterized transport system ATPase subunit